MQDGVGADAGPPDSASDGGRISRVRQGISPDDDDGGAADDTRKPRDQRGDPRIGGWARNSTLRVVVIIWNNQSANFIHTQSGMEQLENLVRLMEELSELRDQNCVLKRKVQVLENLKQGRQQQHQQPAGPDVQKDRFGTRTNYSWRWEVIDLVKGA